MGNSGCCGDASIEDSARCKGVLVPRGVALVLLSGMQSSMGSPCTALGREFAPFHELIKDVDDGSTGICHCHHVLVVSVSVVYVIGLLLKRWLRPTPNT